MQDELGMKEKMINLFAEAELKTDQFLTSLKEQYQHVDVAMVCTVLRPSCMINPVLGVKLNIYLLET